MNNYSQVVKISKDLLEEYGNKITLFESLQIATQIHLAECVTAGLQPGISDEPASLEAIAISLGFSPKKDRMFSSTVADSLKMLVEKE